MMHPLITQEGLKRHHVYYIITFIIAVAGGLFIYMKLQDYMAREAAIADNRVMLQQLQTKLAAVEKTYAGTKDQFKTDRERFQGQILRVLPEGEQYTQLTRDFDNFFEQNFNTQNKLIASSLRFGQGITQADGYAILPVSLSIESSLENFFKFLRFIEESGTLATGNRIMDVQSIRLTLPEINNGGTFNYTVELNAYYRASS